MLGDDGADMYRQGARRLDSNDSWPPNLTRAVEPELVSAVGHMAVRCVLPRGLGDIPVEKIIRLRTHHATEFDAFADAVVATAADLRETLSSVQHPTALQEYLRLAVRRRFETPLQDLESAMKSLRMETGTPPLATSSNWGPWLLHPWEVLPRGPPSSQPERWPSAWLRSGTALLRIAMLSCAIPRSRTSCDSSTTCSPSH